MECRNVDCRVSKNGRCVEGFELAVCPHYMRLERVDSEGGSRTGHDHSDRSAESIRLAASDALTAGQASALLRAGDARVISIVGPLQSGKTSLIAGVYDLFQEGPVNEMRFSRSRTLHAFERTCHDVRSASRRGAPHMYRTPRGTVRFFDLQVCMACGGVDGDGISLIMGDRSGEEYGEATAHASVFRGFPEITGADSFSVLVDGERLLDTGERHNVSNEAILTLQALRDGDALRTGSRVALVLTKLDIVQGSCLAQRASNDFGRLFSRLCGLYGDVFSTIEPFKVAASPMPNTLKRGTGVPDLLSFWMRPADLPAPSGRPSPSSGRAFARLIPPDDVSKG